MSNRLTQLNQQFAGAPVANPTSNVWESMNLDRFLRPEVV